MAGQLNILAFGDQAVPYNSALSKLLAKKVNPTLSTFLDEAYRALKAEIAVLPPSQQAEFPHSSTLTELLIAHGSAKDNNCALDSALACLHQLALFIEYYSESLIQYPEPSSTYSVGSCIGLLAAAAVSSSTNILELLSVGPEVVRIAFRLGFLAREKTSSISVDTQEQGSCSTIVGGINKEGAQQLIDEWCSHEGLPASSSVYISAVGNGSITISGPQKTLRQFFQEHSKLKSSSVPIHGLFHAPHLYTAADVERVLFNSRTSLKNRAARLPILSNLNGTPIPAESFEELLQVALSGMLMKQLRWDSILEGVPALSRSYDFSKCVIRSFAAGSLQSVVASMRQATSAPVDFCNASAQDASSQEAKQDERSNRSKIAIIGFSGRFPDADDNAAFWQLLMDGLDVHREIPSDRFDPWLYFDPTGKKKNTSGVTKGCFIPHPGFFDSRFFNMSPREAEQADPAQRLALMTAYEAIEMAGLVPDATPSTQRHRVGVFYGTTSDDWREVNSGQNVDTYFIPGGNRAFIPGRINYHFRFSGPSYSVDTACSSSLAAIHIACNSLWRGDCDTVVAGGTNVMTNPDNFAGLDRGHFLSRTGNCNTFDDAADGYCRAECVGSVVLKRLEDAQADGDPIFGTILGAYTNHSAESVSITRPHSGAQEAIFKKILNSAGVDSTEVSYIEMHGTGTQHGDATEMKSVLSVFAPEGSSRSQSLHLGSAKSNIGHAESSSGVASLIKVLLMMENNTIPRHPGIKTKINSHFPTDLAQRNVHIARQDTPWTRPTDKAYGRRAFVNNFSAAGGNSSVLLEDAPLVLPDEKEDPRPLHMVAVSAKSQNALRNNIRAMCGFIDENPSVSLGSLSYTTTARRIHHNFRVMVSGDNVSSIKNALQTAEKREKFLAIPSTSAGVGFCFTGQGSQYLGMGKRLLEIPQLRANINRYEDIIKAQGFQSILPIIDGSCATDMAVLPPATLQLAITCLQMALGKLWKSFGVTPQHVIGHSLGEYAALNVSGALSDTDTIYLVGTRANLLEKHCTVGTHAMLAIKASVQKVAGYLANHPSLEVACINGPEDTVVSGPNDDVAVLARSLTEQAIKNTPLKVQFAFHSSQVEPMLESFEHATRSISFKDPSVPIISPLFGTVATTAAELGSASVYLSRHCRETVNFRDALQSASSSGAISEKTMWVELGPHPVCSAMVASTLGPQVKAVPSLRRSEESWKTLITALTALYEKGIPVNWNEYHYGFKDDLRVLRLPAYKWDMKNHWITYAHNWTLTKGNAPVIEKVAIEAAPEKKSSKPFTTSVQHIIEEKFIADEATVTAQSDAHDPDFQRLLEGHKVNGRAVCTSSAYADMALTLFHYLLERSPLEDKDGMSAEVAQMVADKSLIFNPDVPQMLQMTASANWSTRTATFSVSSINKEGKVTANHAKCSGTFVARNAWLSEFKRWEFLVNSRIEHLQQTLENDSESVSLIKTGTFYKLFKALVEYEDTFKGYRELIMNSNEYEATGKVKFTAASCNAGNWLCNPYWIDSIGQITGFIMNGNDNTDSRTQVYINHGWENMRIGKPFTADKTYQTYLKMHDKGDNHYGGDVYILDDGEIIAVYEGVTFAGMPRRVLDMVMPNPNASKTTPAKAAEPKKKAAPAPLAPKPVASKSVPAAVMPPTPPPEANLGANRVKAIIAEEVGLDLAEVKDEEELGDLGVDSLLSLTMAEKIREEMGVTLDSSVFLGATVKSLCDMIAPQPAMSVTSSSPTTADYLSVPRESNSGTSTPATSYPPTPELNKAQPESNKLLEMVTNILAEEIGVETAELQDDAELSSLGLDSLMSLTVLSRLKEEAEVELDPDFLVTHETFGAIRESLTPTVSKPAAPLPSISLDPIGAPTPPEKVHKLLPPASSVLLQGSPKVAEKTLWLFPDGSGLATSYLPLPDLEANTAVFGLNSPFIKKAELMKCTLSELVQVYLNEIRRRQPTGPYYLGGWSAGGICAYDAAQSLIAAGQKVERLILLDSPNPIGLEKLPPRLYEAFDNLNLFGEGGRKPPAWLLPHFLAFIEVLDTYKPVPFKAGTAPKTCIIWAKDGVDPSKKLVTRQADDTREMTWLLNERIEMGPNGWDQLVGREKVAIEVLKSANHFTMMKDAAAKNVSEFIKRAMM